MSIARTLVISPNWIGDAVMAQPLLQLLKAAHPERPIDVLAPAWVSPVWRAMAQVDTVIESSLRHGALQLKQRWQMAQQLRSRHYASAYVLPNTLKFALLPWLAGIPTRVGYRGEMRYGLLNVMHHDEQHQPRSMVAFYAALAAPPARSVPSREQLPRPALTITPEASDATLHALGLLPQVPLVVFAPGAEFGSAKRWPAAYFAQLAHALRQAHSDTQIVLLGSAKDQAVADAIVAAMPAVRSLAGVTSLAQAMALMARAAAVVSNDSGLLHIASALNRPVVALYGPTDPAHAPPFSDIARSLFLDLPCMPCRQRECPLQHHQCMRDLLPQQVWQALRPMLKGTT